MFAGLAFDHMDQVVLPFVIPRYRENWGISVPLIMACLGIETRRRGLEEITVPVAGGGGPDD